ncbi:receptor-type tyrosine-protein phosphatase mu [Sarotherodon galilaeus]
MSGCRKAVSSDVTLPIKGFAPGFELLSLRSVMRGQGDVMGSSGSTVPVAVIGACGVADDASVQLGFPLDLTFCTEAAVNVLVSAATNDHVLIQCFNFSNKGCAKMLLPRLISL